MVQAGFMETAVRPNLFLTWQDEELKLPAHAFFCVAAVAVVARARVVLVPLSPWASLKMQSNALSVSWQVSLHCTCRMPPPCPPPLCNASLPPLPTCHSQCRGPVARASSGTGPRGMSRQGRQCRITNKVHVGKLPLIPSCSVGFTPAELYGRGLCAVPWL